MIQSCYLFPNLTKVQQTTCHQLQIDNVLINSKLSWLSYSKADQNDVCLCVSVSYCLDVSQGGTN